MSKKSDKDKSEKSPKEKKTKELKIEPLPVELYFGMAAGKIWHALNDSGTMSLKHLSKAAEVKDEELSGGLGWLGREGKIEIWKEGKDIMLKLK